MKTPLRLLVLTLLLGGIAVLTGCSRDSVTAPTDVVSEAPGDPATPGDLAFDTDPDFTGSSDTQLQGGRWSWLRRFSRIQFVHASPDAPKVDAYVGFRRYARRLGYPDNTRYRYFWAGERRVRVNVSGTRTSVINERVAFEPRKNYSVFAIGSVKNLEPLVLEDDLSAPSKGNAHVRFVHLSPNAPAVDVALEGGAVVFGDKSFKDATPFTPLPAGTYDLEVRLAQTSDVVLPLPGITLEAGTIYTVFARGFVGGEKGQELGAQIIVNRKARRKF